MANEEIFHSWIHSLLKLGVEILDLTDAMGPGYFKGKDSADICKDCTLKEALRIERTTKKMLEKLQKCKRVDQMEGQLSQASRDLGVAEGVLLGLGAALLIILLAEALKGKGK